MAAKNKQVRKITEEPRQASTRKRNSIAFEQMEARSKKNRYVAGACFIFAGVILFVLAIIPNFTGAVSAVLASAVHLVFGACAYIFPFVFIGIGISLFIDSKDFPQRTSFYVGLGLVCIAFITTVALFAPVCVLGAEQPDLLFSELNLEKYGGYVGNSIAWVLLKLFGRIISAIICIFIFVIGLIVAGFSFTAFKNRASHLLEKTGFDYNGKSEPIYKTDEDFAGEWAQSNENEITLAKNGDIAESSFGSPGITSTQQLEHWQEKLKDKPKRSKSKSKLNEIYSFAGQRNSSDDSPEEPTPNNDASNNPRANCANESTSDDSRGKESDFTLPSTGLLCQPKAVQRSKGESEKLKITAKNLQTALHEFGVDASVVGWVAGPTVTLFKIELPPGVRVNKVQNLGTDLALALATSSVRIFAPIPGTNYVGIEVPNAERQTVVLSEVLKNARGGPLEMAIGKDVEGNSIISDLAKMPHLLIGGTTGSGKSVSVNAMIMSILMRATPDDVRMIMIDPKRVEFTPYNGIPHLYVPVVTEPREAASALSWGVAEMERRLKLMSEVRARNIIEYNAKVKSGELNSSDDKDTSQEGDESASAENKYETLPYIVIIIDELADLMMSVGKEVEASIVRIAQLARAAGIHLIVATQRPSTNVVTGLIKSNITNRIAFNVASSIDSRVILDTTGAEDLIGLGDMLLSKPELGKPVRIQGCFVSEEEISKVVSFIKEQAKPDYKQEILSTSTNVSGSCEANPRVTGAGGDDDPLLWEAAELIVSSGIGSTSNIQRRLKVGYARAGRIVDQLEEKGIVGSANGSKPREVLVDELELESVKTFEMND